MEGNLQDFEEVRFIPSALEALGLDTGFDGLFVLEQVESDVAQGGQIGRSSAGAHPIVVLI